MSARKSTVAKRQSEVIEEKQATAVLERVKGITLQKTVEGFAQKQMEVSRGIAELMGSLTQDINLLGEVEQAISLKRDELKNLHNIEANATTLDDLNFQIAQTRQTWTDEQAAHQKTLDEQNAARQQDWKREQEQHTYEITQRNVRADTEHKSLVEANKRNETIRQEQLVKGWNEREMRIAAREDDIKKMEARIAGIDGEIKTAVDRQVSIVSNTLKKDYEHQASLSQVQSESKMQIASSTISQHTQTIIAKDKQIADLTAQLGEANKRAETIASQAVQASSGRQALEAVQRNSETLATNTGKR